MAKELIDPKTGRPAGEDPKKAVCPFMPFITIPKQTGGVQVINGQEMKQVTIEFQLTACNPALCRWHNAKLGCMFETLFKLVEEFVENTGKTKE